MDLISPVMKAKRSDPRSSILRLLASLASFWLMLPLLLLLFIALSRAPSMAAFCCCGCAQKTHRQLSTYNNSLNTCECAPKNHSYTIRDSALMGALKTQSCKSGFCPHGCSQNTVVHIQILPLFWGPSDLILCTITIDNFKLPSLACVDGNSSSNRTISDAAHI
jgi:hypothetical protein